MKTPQELVEEEWADHWYEYVEEANSERAPPQKSDFYRAYFIGSADGELRAKGQIAALKRENIAFRRVLEEIASWCEYPDNPEKCNIAECKLARDVLEKHKERGFK